MYRKANKMSQKLYPSKLIAGLCIFILCSMDFAEVASHDSELHLCSCISSVICHTEV